QSSPLSLHDALPILIKTDGTILDLAAALYIYNDYEVYYLSSGSNPKYNTYMGAYRLQWEMIKFAKAHNIQRYNFYRITGDFSEKDRKSTRLNSSHVS